MKKKIEDIKISKTPKTPKFRTQKLRGYATLHAHAEELRINVPTFRAVTDAKTLAKAVKETDYPVFARPCPVVPRHGFVDSRIVKSKVGLEKIWKEARAEDSKAELILTTPVDCSASAVVTPNQITIGPGNDGATQGHETISLPLADVVRVPHDVLSQAGVTHVPYLEVLFPVNSHNVKIVQLRDGPKSQAVGNIIFADTKVTRVLDVRAYPNLLKWEKVIAQAKPGTVVYHPGGSAVSHYAVHAVLHSIPVIFDTRPSIGVGLKKTETETEYNLEGIKLGIKEGFNLKSSRHDLYRIIDFSLLATHQALTLAGSAEGSKLVGLSAALLTRLGYAACFGEYRHNTKPETTLKIVFAESRESTYHHTQTHFTIARKYVPIVYKSFLSKKGWPSGGYGGKKWAACLKATVELENSLLCFVKCPSKALAAQVIAKMHNTVNAAHNNGPFLNKFALDTYGRRTIFDYMAKNDLYTVLGAAYKYWRWLRREHEYTNVKLSSRKEIQLCKKP